jgi:hypothetical protein
MNNVLIFIKLIPKNGLSKDTMDTIRLLLLCKKLLYCTVNTLSELTLVDGDFYLF